MGWLRRVFGAVSDQEMQGLRLHEPRWQLSTSADLADFLRALPKLVPDDAILFLEGGSQTSDLRGFLQAHRIWPAMRPALGTVWPRQPTFALPTTVDFLNSLAAQVESCAAAEVCTHLHVYRGDEVLLEGYDAFSRPFHVSAGLSEERLSAFCSELGAAWSRTNGAS